MVDSTHTPLHAERNARETFLLLKENRFAHAAIGRLTRQSRAATVPLVLLYGASGVGKSHLARHYLRDVRRGAASLKFAHVTASQFAAEFADALAAKSADRFQQRYRELDVLVCEDLGLLENRLETQRQLVFAMDEIIGCGGQCLLTCRISPGQLLNTLPRLVSRCHAGVCAAVRSPGPQSRVSLINHFAATQQIPIPTATIQMLAAALPVSPRELMSTLQQMDAIARLERSTIDRQFVRRYLDGEIKAPAIKLTDIARAVAKQFGVSVSDLRSPKRLQGQVLPRHCAMYLGRELTGEALQSIAAFFGRRNHSSVIHACNQMKLLLSEDPTLRRHISQIFNAVGRPESRRCS